MEANRRQCSEIGSVALRAIATTCSGGDEKGAYRAIAGVGKRSDHFPEILRTKMGTRGISTYCVRANSGTSLNSDGEMGQETQKTPGRERNWSARRQSPSGARTQRAQTLMSRRSITWRIADRAPNNFNPLFCWQ